MTRFWTFASVVFVAAFAGAAPGKSADGDCSRTLPQAPAGLPAALVVTTNCGRFGLEPGGNVVYEGPWTSPVPPVASGYWMDLTWYGIADGHLLIGRGQTQLWRSRDTYPGPRTGDIDAVVLGVRGLAFSYYEGRRSRLYLAGYGEAERAVARGETPLTFTGADELVTWRERGGVLALRTASGRLERRLALRAKDPKVNRESQMVVFRDAGRLLVFDGARVRELASLRKIGVTGVPTVEPLGRLVAVHDRRRLVVLGYNGSLFASTVLRARRKWPDGVSSSVVANADGTAVAYTATRFGAPGRETVYLLKAGARWARPLFTEELYFNVCERGAWLDWQGRWLLYADSEQHAAVVDSSAESPPIELGDPIAQLPGISPDDDGMFDVAWA